MIETREAIQNLDSILDLKVENISTFLDKNVKTQGVDGAFLGPADLSISFGVSTDLGLPK